MTDFTKSNWQEQMDAEYKDLEEKDQAGKKAGTLVGRYIQEQRGDGYALYQITGVRARTVIVKHMDVGDAWTSPMIESMDLKVPIKYARENIGFRDGIAELFSKR